MKVYIVMESNYVRLENGEISFQTMLRKVYSTRENAERYVEATKILWRLPEFEVVEMEVE